MKVEPAPGILRSIDVTRITRITIIHVIIVIISMMISIISINVASKIITITGIVINILVLIVH